MTEKFKSIEIVFRGNGARYSVSDTADRIDAMAKTLSEHVVKHGFHGYYAFADTVALDLDQVVAFWICDAGPDGEPIFPQTEADRRE